MREYLEKGEMPTLEDLRSLPQHGEHKEPPAPDRFIKIFLKQHVCIINDKQTNCWKARWKFGDFITEIKCICFNIINGIWWVCFATLNYGILRTIGADDGWEIVGRKCVVNSLLFMGGMHRCIAISQKL